MEGIANRIQELVAKLNLKPSSFASEIAVSPSILSHVLNGRNKPSLDLILKIHSAFPDVDLEWLLTGDSTLNVEEVPMPEPPKSQSQPKIGARILILHSNGTYEEFVKS